MKPHVTPIKPGSGLLTPLLARNGRTLLGLRRVDGATALSAIDLDSGVTRWHVALQSWPTLCLHERAGFVATCEADRLTLWDLDTGGSFGKGLDGFHAHAALPGSRLLTLEDVPGVGQEGVHVDEGTRACLIDTASGVIQAHFGLAGRAETVAVDEAGARLLAYTSVVAPAAAPNAAALFRSVLWDIARRAPLLALDASLSSAALKFRPGTGDILILPYHHQLGGPLVLTIETGEAVAPRLSVAVILDDDKERAPLQSSALSPDGRFLATSHADQRDNHWVVGCALCLWDLQTLTRVYEVALTTSSWPTLLSFDEHGGVRGVCETWDRRELYIVPRSW